MLSTMAPSTTPAIAIKGAGVDNKMVPEWTFSTPVPLSTPAPEVAVEGRIWLAKAPENRYNYERLFLGVLREDLFFFLKINFSQKFLFSLYSYSGLLVLT